MFYMTYEIVQRPIGQLDMPPNFCLNIPWGHNISLIEKVKTLQEREWYARAAVEYGWSRTMLELWIESGLYHRKL
jgi:predicted nuclease of restriction endonuclease-like (RecB) superfamily